MADRRPLLSIVVIVYDMPRQALNTLHSLAPRYQTRARAGDYEVIVVENRSPRTIEPAAVAALPRNFRYILRDEAGVSPAAAINEGFAAAQGSHVGLMIDGARMVTPGVVEHVLMACRITPDALVAVPGYHLGPDEQHLHDGTGYDERKEQELLERIDWPRDGYRLFEIGCWSGANRHGYFHPFMECNCLFMPSAVFRDIGQADERFDLPGGGALNLAIWRKAALHPRTRLFMLPGEGSFHQLHGGVTTSGRERREEFLKQVYEQLCELIGEKFRSPEVEPVMLGRLRGPMLPFMITSAQKGIKRHQRFGGRLAAMYADDVRKQGARSTGARGPQDPDGNGSPT